MRRHESNSPSSSADDDASSGGDWLHDAHLDVLLHVVRRIVGVSILVQACMDMLLAAKDGRKHKSLRSAELDNVKTLAQDVFFRTAT